jgi:hypothetical protein
VGRRSVKVMLIRAKRHLRDLLQARGIRGKVMTDWSISSDDEERAIAMFMSRVANVRVPDPESPILSSNTLWWKAKLLDKWEAERRAQWPLDIMQPIENRWRARRRRVAAVLVVAVFAIGRTERPYDSGFPTTTEMA